MSDLKNEKNEKRRHTGVGVLILTSYFGEPYILLGQEKWKTLDYSMIGPGIKIPIYEEFGGGIQTNKVSLEKNAIFELREETANLFNIPESILNKSLYFDIPYLKDRMYRIYLLYLDNICDYLHYFYINIGIINANKSNFDKSNKYLEMNKINLIPLKKIKETINNIDNYICLKSEENKNNIKNNNNLCGILRINDDIFLNSRLIQFLNSKYNKITGLQKCYNYYQKCLIKSGFPKNNNNKIKNIKQNNKQYIQRYYFLENTWSLIIKN